MTSRRISSVVALAAASALALAGCATPAPSDSGEEGGDRIAVVASTNVYGQIVEEIGGDLVEVTSIVSSASQDPHSFEPSAQDQLAVARAALVVENGGGYDAFIDGLIESTGSEAHVITAAEFSHDWPENEGHEDASTGSATEDEHGHGEHEHEHVEGFNEHVWYDPHTIEHVAEAIAAELSEIAPDDADTFDANLEAFVGGIEKLETALAAADADFGGSEIFATEPVPLYLTAAAGLVNVAPENFTEAVEEGQDVPAATLLEAMQLLQAGTVKAVIVNAQTGGAETTAVMDEADKLGIPIVEFAETLPEGQTYLSWMQSNIEALETALQE